MGVFLRKNEIIFDEYNNVSFDDRVRQLYKATKNKNK